MDSEKDKLIQASLMETYADLILIRDKARKKADAMFIRYVQEFGDLIEEDFKLTIEIIKLKRGITYCQKQKNYNRKIYRSKLDEYLESVMEDYYYELNEILEIKSYPYTTIPRYESLNIRKAYKEIAMTIHPDIYPEAFANEEIRELWEKAKQAYINNDYKSITETEIAVKKLLNKKIPFDKAIFEDVEQKIDEIMNEIETIKTTEPYTYSEFLFNSEASDKKKAEFAEKIAERKEAITRLNEVIEQFDIKELLS